SETPQTPQSKVIVLAGRSLPVFEAVDTPFAVFFTDAIIADKSNTVVLFRYYFSIGYEPFFINLQIRPETQSVIVQDDYPIVDAIKGWSKISTQNIVLYQKVGTYETVEQFLGAVPQNKTVVADPSLIFSRKIAPGSQVLSLNEWQEGNEFDYF